MSAIKKTVRAADAVIAALEECGRKPKTIAPYRRTYRALIAYLENSGAERVPAEDDCLAFLNEAAGTSLPSLFAATDSNKAREMRRPLALLVRMLSDGEVDVTARSPVRTCRPTDACCRNGGSIGPLDDAHLG